MTSEPTSTARGVRAPAPEAEPLESVADNPQLEARDWFVPYRAAGDQLKSPGAPYHFSATPWQLGDYEPVAPDADAVKDALGWDR